MKRLNGYRMRYVLVGVVAAMMLIGGRANAVIIMSEPTNVGPVINDAYDVQESDFSHDGLQLYFALWNRPDGFGSGDIYMAERETLSSPRQEPVNLGPNVNSSAGEIEPSISSDGLELYFGSWDDWFIRVCKRLSRDDSWSTPVKVESTIGYDAYGPDISADGLSLYFASRRGGGHGGHDIWVARRATTIDPWTEPVNLGPNVNSGATDWSPSISDDGLTLVFSRGLQSIWATTRKSIEDDWGAAVQLGINGPGNSFSPALSPDSSTLYFQAVSGWGGFGENDFWQVKFIPIVDFNSDGIVDITDLAVLIEHWGEEDLSFDIGPLPLGDGMVDQADLEVLMNHWEQEVLPPDLIAYWKLDEMEGDIAYDSARTNDAAVLGGAAWLPKGGMVDGAIAFDGIDDYIDAPFVLNPADGAFSVLAWIKGGAPGQVIVSQTNGTVDCDSIWLCADPTDGRLMTGLLPPPGRSQPMPLGSEHVITDGQWHHVGFVWDGSYRHLYVDGTEVAKDAATLSDLESADGGLHFGAGSTLTPGTFFSGLIDDVRIYNRAVSP
ncbi:MAG: PD40 domain-containing protein [Phycisphaerae bacterium]|nr:PD40 domain-containing protein [Phycisphaerae bacterium]